MRVSLIFLLLSVFIQNSFSQTDFCLPGARWMYEDYGSSANAPNQIHVIYQGDTVLNGVDGVKILKVENRINWFDVWQENQEFLTYTRVLNDSVYQLAQDTFRFIYDFDVQEGDQRVVYIGGDDLCAMTDTMQIDSIRNTNYQGESLRTYYYHFLIEDQLAPFDGYYEGGGGGAYMERIGLVATHPALLTTYCWSGNIISEYHNEFFLCYTDDELGAVYPDTCNLFLDASEPETQETSVTVYQSQVLVQNTPNSTIHIYNILGKQLFQERITSDNQSFNIDHLPNGILMVVVETEEGRLTKKVVKASL